MTDSERSALLFDALLKAAVREAYGKEIRALTDEEALSGCSPSPALDKRIDDLIKKSFRKIKVKRFSKSLGKAAACLCVLLTISSTILMSVGATRNAILNAILSWQEQYTEIRFENSTASRGAYRPSYLPEGFRETTVKSSGNSTTILYENDAGDMIFFIQQEAGNASTLVDNENTEFFKINVSGKTGLLFKAKTGEDSSILLWEENGIAFSLTSVIDSGELVRMGESIK